MTEKDRGEAGPPKVEAGPPKVKDVASSATADPTHTLIRWPRRYWSDLFARLAADPPLTIT